MNKNTDKRYFVLYKPYGMVSQFISSHPQPLLGDLQYKFPAGTHAIGRLDYHSEGLLLLTTDKSVTRRLFTESVHERIYYVLVEHRVTEEALEKLRNGIEIGVKGKGYRKTDPCEVKVLNELQFQEREPPYKMYNEHCWLEFKLAQGLNRQIRKMCAAVRHKCQRLVRYSIEGITIEGMKSGDVKELGEQEFFELLRIPH